MPHHKIDVTVANGVLICAENNGTRSDCRQFFSMAKKDHTFQWRLPNRDGQLDWQWNGDGQGDGASPFGNDPQWDSGGGSYCSKTSMPRFHTAT